ncbi:MAG TPA: branched-chain amino acid ABC transporter permease [Candidatus Peribacteraceae bacterium]|nr:branched-chain amino acid ABC transporter permease [Candidatus Peribacteraceae bacterium]
MTFLLHVITITCTSVPHILGFNIVLGKGKILHFGPLGTSIVAAYVTFLTTIHFSSYTIGILCGLVAVVLVSTLYAWVSFRMEPDGFGVMSIAMHLSFMAVVLNWSSVTRGALGIPRIPRFPFLNTTADFAIATLIVAVVWVVLLLLLERSSFGRKLTALSEQEWQANALGISRYAVHWFAFLIAGIGALIMNVLYHQYIFLVYPSDFAFSYLIFMVMVVVAGKPGSTLGCTVSVILLTFLREGIRFLPLEASVLGPLRLIFFGSILLAVVYWRRDVLFPKPRSI